MWKLLIIESLLFCRESCNAFAAVPLLIGPSILHCGPRQVSPFSICSQWAHFSTMIHVGEASFKVTRHLCDAELHVTSMQHLSYTVVYFLTPVVGRADIKTYQHSITVILLCSGGLACCIYIWQCCQMLKISGTEVVQNIPKLFWWWSRMWHLDHSGTKMDWICTEMVYPVVPNMTSTERDLTHSSNTSTRLQIGVV